MRRFKYVLDYLRTAIKEGATYTAKTYMDELGQLHDEQLIRNDEHLATIAARDAKIGEHLKHNDDWRKENAEQAFKLVKLHSEVLQYEAANLALFKENARLRGQAKRMDEARAAEKALKIGEWYGAGGSFGDVVQKGKSIVFGGMDPAWQECPPDPRYSTPNTKTPDHTWRANPDKKWETSYTKRIVDELQRVARERLSFRGARHYKPNAIDTVLQQGIELLTDYHSTMHEVYEERDAARKTIADTAVVVRSLNEQYDWKKVQWETVLDTNADLRRHIRDLGKECDFAKKQHEAALASMGQLNTRISDLVKERDAASATVKARIREAVGL